VRKSDRGFSHLLALFLLAGLGICFAQTQTYDYRLVDDRCDPNQCLFVQRISETNGYLDSVTGTVRVSGYYAKIVREYSTAETVIPRKPLICPALKVTGAPKFFQKAFKQLVERGNTVNRLGKEGQLVLAVSFDKLKLSEIEHVKRANRQHPVSLTLLKPIVPEGEIFKCGSLFQILRVENVKR